MTLTVLEDWRPVVQASHEQLSRTDDERDGLPICIVHRVRVSWPWFPECVYHHNLKRIENYGIPTMAASVVFDGCRVVGIPKGKPSGAGN